MLHKIITILFLNLFFLNTISAQVIDLTGQGLGTRLRLQHIHPSEGRLGNSELLKVRNANLSMNSGISEDAKFMILNNQLIKDDGENFRKIELPIINDISFRNLYLSSNNQYSIITQFIEEIDQTKINYFDNYNESLEISFTFQGPFLGIFSSSDASILIANSRQVLYVVERNGSAFEKIPVSNKFIRQIIISISSSGDRIFFFGLTQENDEFETYILNRISGKWSVPSKLRIFDNENELFLVKDIAHNGRTLLIHHPILGYAITHDVNGKWSPPQPLGYIPKSGDEAQISENAKVVVIQSAKKYTETSVFYDLFVLMQNTSGEWVQHQVNDPELEVRDGILLSGDGTKLFWLPANTSFIPNAMLFK